MIVPSCSQRGWWGYEAIKAHQRVKGFDSRYVDPSVNVIVETLSDVLHWADMEGIDADTLMLKALISYKADKELEEL